MSRKTDPRVIVRPEMPVVGRMVRDPDEITDDDSDIVVLTKALDFTIVEQVIRREKIRGVIISENGYPDHARKMLQEAGIAVVSDHGLVSASETAGACLIDNHGAIPLGDGSVRISAICSLLNGRNLRLYRRLGVEHLGYFRYKFCLFQLLATEPDADQSPDRIEQYLFDRTRELAEQGWKSVRVVLSDPTSAELRDLGVPCEADINPDLGIRGPRDATRWIPELRAVQRVLDHWPDMEIGVCAPFIGSVEEYRLFEDLARSFGLDRAQLGLTVEIPALVHDLPDLIDECRVNFVAVGTSDLFALYNGIDRNNPALAVDSTRPANVRLLEAIVGITATAGIDCLVCGEIRRNPEVMSTLVRSGVTELITSASMSEFTAVARIASHRPLAS